MDHAAAPRPDAATHEATLHEAAVREVPAWPYLLVLAGSVLAAGALLTADSSHPATALALGALPTVSVLAAGAVARLVAIRSGAAARTAGHVAVGSGVAVLTVVTLAARDLAGPAMLVGGAFALLAWFRRDAVLGAGAVATVVACAPLDSLGPVPFDAGAGDGSLRLVSFAVVASVLLGAAAVSRGRSRRPL